MNNVSICLDCAGTGRKTHFNHINSGVCYTCKGSGLAMNNEIAATKERSPSVAIIGSRRINENQAHYLESVAQAFVRRGYVVRTGCAEGADHASMVGARSIDPSKLELYLPWASYNKDLQLTTDKKIPYNPSIHTDWAESVHKYHPNPRALTSGAFNLMARNWGIIMHDHPVDLVVAMPASAGDMGGTGQGIRIARDNDIPIYLVYNKEDRQSLKSFLLAHKSTT